MEKCVGVIGGTALDTGMGVEFLNRKGIGAAAYPSVKKASNQTRLQMTSVAELSSRIEDIIEKIKSDGIDTVMIYCNSLSSTVDMDRIAMEKSINIITPLTVYREIALNYKKVGVMAGNNQGLAGIERTLLGVNPDCSVIGVGLLPLVMDIERKVPAEKIIEKYGVRSLLQFYRDIRVELIILGCTHFPYLADELKKNTAIPLFNPAESMYQLIMKDS